MNKRTILIVDDQQINRRILKKLLENNYNIMEAENGQLALKILHENSSKISAVLLDIVMPVLDGYGVLEGIQNDHELSSIPVIVTSQKEGDEAELHALSLGAYDFVSKPYKADIILHRIENTIHMRETAAIANQAEKDELTGLQSKQFFLKTVAEVIKQNTDTAYNMLCFDIEKFKLVNDTFGERTGDELLCHIASLLSRTPGAVCTSRFNADHFYQLFPQHKDSPDKTYMEFFEKVKEFPFDMKINVNCGVYPIDDIDASVVSMCDRAKLAADINSEHIGMLYSVYNDSVRQKLLKEQFIVGAMSEGLSEHQFQVYYQPKYDLHSEMISGAEALVRWIHPEKGFMSPGEFIPVFERNGFITQLDRYVWEEACKNLRSWIDNELPLVPISVNVSRADIFNPNLTEYLIELVNRYELPMKYLHLEITESAYTDNPQQIIEVVGRLHDAGFIIEMDDFGSGYSSLNMLSELPVDILKLDMGFVQTETKNKSGRGIMSFVISLAKWMKLSVVAEGVETAHQIEALRSMDCNYVQGYYFAKPMPQKDFENSLLTTAVVSMEQTAEDCSDAEKAPIVIEEDASKDKKVMLIVDDIEINRAVLRRMFRNEYIIVEKENGRLALNYLQKHYEDVEVVLLDLLMPVMDGFQLISKMKDNEALSEMPIVVASQGDISAEERALELGADDFISKPYSPSVVKHRVNNVIEIRHRQLEKQNELEQTKEHERTLMSSIPGGVATYHLKKNGKLVAEFVSDGFAKLCGYSTEEFSKILRKDATANTIPEDVPNVISAIRSGMESKSFVNNLQHMRTKSGNLITVRFDASVTTTGKMADDDLAIVYAVLTKVSSETETMIREQERYRYILDNLDVAFFEFDEHGAVYTSDKYSEYKMSESSTDNILNDDGDYSSVFPEDIPILFEFLRQKKRKLPKISCTLRLEMKDGTYRWTEMLGFLEFDSNGNIVQTFGVLRDVDAEWQKQNRKLQKALDEAESANRSKTEFLARVSHEMRTPLNGILGLTELISGKKEGESIEKDLAEIKHSGHYLLDLINDTLDVNTIEKGRMQLHPIVCDGKTTLQNVISMVKPSMDEKHIKFNMVAENLPYTILYIDAGRVEQAVMNVLNNAIKFTPEDGVIEVKMENISTENNVITDRITIKDNGIGIGKDFIGHIFEPFSQEHDSDNSQYAGTGLGMTIAKQCVELMGGTISVKSELRKGTEVSIILPMQIAKKEQLDEWHNEQENSDLNALRGKRILLCEDHPLNAQIVIRLLEKKNVHVDLAENGRIGVQLFEESPNDYYSAVLMDIRMPVMNGLEATVAIRKLKRKDARRIPIIALTANTLREDVKNSINAGMTEHIGKPIEPDRLYRVLEKLITKPVPFAGRKVLVADDIEINRGLIKGALKETYTVLEASNGKEALDILKQNKDIVAIVTDIQMPVMDGKELIRRIRADRDFDDLAIIANTIYGDHRQEDELLSSGATDFVYKPTSPMVIQMRLEHILRNKM